MDTTNQMGFWVSGTRMKVMSRHTSPWSMAMGWKPSRDETLSPLENRSSRKMAELAMMM